jgi:uncharacterized ion transporter superfamily protein YfcC
MSTALRVPHTLVLLFAMMVLALAATWVLPQGRFETVKDDKGRELVVPGTYAQVEERVVLTPIELFTVVPRALEAAGKIIFFVLLVGGAIAVLRATGMIDAVLGWVLKRIGGSPPALIVIGMSLFALVSGLIGVAEEYIPFAAMLIALCLAMRMDAITAMGIMVGGYGIGYGVALLNPFTLIPAQGVAGLEPASGALYRALLFVPFVAIGIHHVWSYARRVQADPSKSLMAGIETTHRAPTTFPELSPRLAAVLCLAVLTLVAMSLGIYFKGWYLVELGALFLALAVLAGLVAGLGFDETAKRFVEGASELAGTALLIGFARSIALLLEDGQVLHTIVHALSVPLSQLGAELAVVGMLLIQTLINFFIPSGSGQAFVTMPIMAPLSDLLGISRQTAVLAFQMGDGFSNMIVPTNIVLMSILGIAGIPYDRWFRFIWPLMLKLTIAGSIALVAAVLFGYQ